MNYKVVITENKTGNQKEIYQDFSSDEHIIYIYQDGNYACDGNRAGFFNNTTAPCGMELFSVQIYKGDVLIYSEID